MVQKRRGRFGIGSAERRVMQLAAGIIGLAVIVSAVLVVAGRTTETAGTSTPAAEIRMSGFEFRPSTFEVPSGASVILVENADSFVHTFTVPALDIDRAVLPGTRARIEIDAPSGSYTVYCTPHSDLEEADPQEAGMAASLIVR